ncbi:Delta(12) fatty acid desaturase [Lachnellula willkommii]|uniref:Delta(12) fatty acid desaturase n=1 Tax=Lachnellula willkommii TaxID=215461 RepID=A0A559MIS2_9HELO|nr:Delta(12) fatty acid desaturase [Lachnellula willkommii]
MHDSTAAQKATNTDNDTNLPTERFFTPPTYTMKQIHDAIPAHCFQRNTLLSAAYVLRDFFLIAVLFYLSTQISNLPSHFLRTSGWWLYSFCQGLVFTGLWELAHECGHGALSKHKSFNNSVGLFIHSLLLVPYNGWRITHSQHHKSTNNIERDIAFVPDTKEVFVKAHENRKPDLFFSSWSLVEDTPIIAFITLFFHQLIAWPIYLTINNFALPRMNVFPWWTRSHFYFGGDGPNFKASDRNDIIMSNIGIAVVVTGLWAGVQLLGFEKVFLLYGAPWLWTNHWILAITYLQHTDPALPYYQTSSWSFLRGAASTVDRDFGFIGRFFFHGAIDFHVLHHHASRIPFYHAVEANDAIKKVMGSHYQSDRKSPFLWAFWKNYTKCRFVEEKDVGSNIYFFAK